jgi:hypothetical protein
VIAVVGSDPMTRVIMRAGRGSSLNLTGPHEAALARLARMEVWITGRPIGSDFSVSAFAVRAVDGVPAVDGILTERNGALSVVPSDRRAVAIDSPPTALHAHVGERVWVTLAAGQVQSFGVIGPSR